MGRLRSTGCLFRVPGNLFQPLPYLLAASFSKRLINITEVNQEHKKINFLKSRVTLGAGVKAFKTRKTVGV